MNIEYAVREALSDIANDTLPVAGLAPTALHQARRRQYATRTVMAGAAAAVTIPVGMAVLHDPGANSGQVSPGLAAQPPATDLDAAPPPAAHELGDDELATVFDACLHGANGGEDGWEPAFGITIDAELDPGMPATWVAAQRNGDYRADCALDSSGNVISGGFFSEYGLKSTPDLLYALVDAQEGDSVGRYVDPVAHVTVQYEGDTEQHAVLRGGFWFFPLDETRSAAEGGDQSASPEDAEQDAEQQVPGGVSDLIGVPVGYTVRGYDSDGQLVYDSSTDGPSAENCYADPTGTEIVGNGAGHSDPSDCITTHRWRPLPNPASQD